MTQYTQISTMGVLAIVILSFGCGVAEKRQARDELEEGRAKWESLGIQDYEMTMETFCPDVVTGPADVVVQDNEVVAVYNPGTTEPKTYLAVGINPLTEQEIKDCYLTIDELFELYEDIMSERLTRAELRTDPTLGYPTWAVFDPSRRWEDDGYALEITRLEPSLPPQ